MRHLFHGITALLILAGLFSCNISHKIASGYLGKHRDTAAAWSARDFPCISDSIRPGIPIHVRDTQYLPGDSISCPDHFPDSGKMIFVQCPPQRIIHDSVTIRDTAFVLDSAALTILYDQVKTLTAANAKLTAQNADLKDQLTATKNQSKNRLIWIIALAGIMTAGAAGWVIAKFNLL